MSGQTWFLHALHRTELKARFKIARLAAAEWRRERDPASGSERN